MKQISIKWKLFIFFGLFTIIIIGLLWLFQVVFLDDFYKVIKEKEVKRAAEAISANVSDPELETLIAALSYQSELNISIYSSGGEHLITYLGRADRTTPNLLQLFIDARKQANSKQHEDYVIVYENPIDSKPSGSSDLENMTLVKYVDGYFIVINSLLVPVVATVSTLQIQLIFITGTLLLIALILAVILSRIISNPIIALNRSAKILATGNYQVKFDGDGYKEITELKDTLNYATDELSKVDSLRRELIANISHDLRTPLTMITGYSEAMRDLPNENTKENIQIVIDEAKRLTSLVNDVLDISKLESGNMSLNIINFSFTDLIKSTIERYEKLTDYNYIFTYEEEVLTDGDITQITQVLYNLINNAVTHTGEDKSISIRQSLIHDTTDKSMLKFVKIEVIDTGAGIPKDQLVHIWNRYYKVDKTHKRSVTGSGLGLSIVKNIINNHHGTFGVLSDENGSNFWFTLPLKNY